MFLEACYTFLEAWSALAMFLEVCPANRRHAPIDACS